MVWAAAFVALALWPVALLHLYWALGGTWPGRDPADLAGIVVGTGDAGPGGRMPGPGLTLAVAGMIGLAGLWPLIFVGVVPLPVPSWLVRAGMWTLAVLFGLRGAVAYLPGAWQGARDLPFYRLNRRWFSPLILVLGAVFLGLAILGSG